MAHQHCSQNADELLAQSLAMQDLMDFQQNTTTLQTKSNNTNNSQHQHIRLPNTSNTSNISNTTNPKPPPKVLNEQCLTSILNNYISRKSLISLGPDISSTNPDIYNLFFKYNYLYFDNKLSGCVVKWSKRMTLCAGLCCYEGGGGLCSIKLSSPLLQYRSTKEMIETLIHEMIHAYLFVTFNNKDRESHGQRFKTFMNVINYASHLDISIYHTFHDEVDQCRTHIWKCNGVCQQKSPYFGVVKRSMNRAPGPNDRWWSQHARNCGGSYTKISEPKAFTEKQRKKKEREERKKEREEKKKLKAEMKKNNINANGKGTERKKGQKRKREKDKSVRTLVDMFGNGKGGDEALRKRQKIEEKIEENNSDLEILENTDNNYNKNRNGNNGNNGNALKVKCPICQEMLVENMINLHLDDCLS